MTISEIKLIDGSTRKIVGFYSMVRAYFKIRHILKQRIRFAKQIKVKATLIEYKCGKIGILNLACPCASQLNTTQIDRQTEGQIKDNMGTENFINVTHGFLDLALICQFLIFSNWRRYNKIYMYTS